MPVAAGQKQRAIEPVILLQLVVSAIAPFFTTFPSVQSVIAPQTDLKTTGTLTRTHKDAHSTLSHVVTIAIILAAAYPILTASGARAQPDSLAASFATTGGHDPEQIPVASCRSRFVNTRGILVATARLIASPQLQRPIIIASFTLVDVIGPVPSPVILPACGEQSSKTPATPVSRVATGRLGHCPRRPFLWRPSRLLDRALGRTRQSGQQIAAADRSDPCATSAQKDTTHTINPAKRPAHGDTIVSPISGAQAGSVYEQRCLGRERWNGILAVNRFIRCLVGIAQTHERQGDRRAGDAGEAYCEHVEVYL
ncbi:uncharacterized protein E0L32_009747 [Thyridium curvatum]|uniref:Uncharacterized protein n=1 Tax=Thyridium curvatum TaxID=1093900 RepID=A0A507ANC2_9PEZI|nr:uncharacterized protein E0L32_009747 [Thyridium curvatum]TPX08807.1 hypothetical protein E0L32_009747 [Thyridium curvatum]